MKESYKINDELSWREVDGQILILDTIETESAHELNPMASLIFDLISQGFDKSGIEEELIQTYQEVKPEEIKSDLNLFLGSLLEKKIITPS